MNAPTKMTEQMPWSREEFEANLRAKGKSYNINHPTANSRPIRFVAG